MYNLSLNKNAKMKQVKQNEYNSKYTEIIAITNRQRKSQP